MNLRFQEDALLFTIWTMSLHKIIMKKICFQVQVQKIAFKY